MIDLTLLIPVKNEIESLGVFLDKLESFEFEKLLVIDCKDNNDYEKIIKNKKKLRTIKSTNTGYGQALIDGINNTNTEFFCIINADGSMDPKDLNEMIKLTNDFSFIFASRYLSGGGSEDDTLITLIGNKFFTLFGKIFYNLKISDILYTYILGRTDLAKKLNLKNKDFRICIEIPIKIHKNKFSYRDVASYELARLGGKKKVNVFKDGLLILGEMIKLLK